VSSRRTPGKSRLDIFYIDRFGLWVDHQLLMLTGVAIVSKPRALRGVVAVLRRLGAPADFIDIAKRDQPLVPAPRRGRPRS
jgi:hypothetical protein